MALGVPPFHQALGRATADLEDSFQFSIERFHNMYLQQCYGG